MIIWFSPYLVAVFLSKFLFSMTCGSKNCLCSLFLQITRQFLLLFHSLLMGLSNGLVSPCLFLSFLTWDSSPFSFPKCLWSFPFSFPNCRVIPPFVFRTVCHSFPCAALSVKNCLESGSVAVRSPCPACHFDADADPNRSFQVKAQNLEKVLK